MQSYRRPDYVPALNLQGLPDYVSSSDEEEEEDENDEQEQKNNKS